MGNYRMLRRLARLRALDAETAERLITEQDGGPGSGNFGHAGRPGKVGGSGESGSGGRVSGNLGQSSSGQKFIGKEYSLPTRGIRSIKRVTKGGKAGWNGPGKTWVAKGKSTKTLPKGSGTTKISEQDVAMGLHTINKYLKPDGTLTPGRAALHDKIIDGMFKGKKPAGPGEQKTFYFLGGGSASGKSNFTSKEKSSRYGMPDKDACTVIDADELKNSIPEYQYDQKTGTGTGTTDRNKAASFAHEESSALAKRAMEAAIANGYNFTLDGTGDSGAEKVIKKIEQARQAGYRVEGKYCTRDIEEAIKSNLQRAAETGRLVQLDSVVEIHKSISKIFPEVASKFDHCELWDHNGDKPVLIASCDRDGKIKQHDPVAYKKFLDKVNFDYNPEKYKSR